VDLAGSERIAKSEVAGQQLKEAQAINKSLSALGDVIQSLQSKSAHVPYRNSKLTQVPADSLLEAILTARTQESHLCLNSFQGMRLHPQLAAGSARLCRLLAVCVENAGCLPCLPACSGPSLFACLT
jgi:hypothetical protein